MGESFVMYFGDEKREPCTSALAEATVFVAWVALSDTTYLLADDYGNLHRLELKVLRGSVLDSMTVQVIGTTSRATCLLKITEDCIFVGSHQGHSQVITLGSSPGSLEVLQTFSNIAPILDFAVMDLGTRASDSHLNEYSSGQARIITGSGAYQDGSLKSVCSGVGLEDRGILGEIGGIQRLFSLRSSESKKKVDTLLASLLEDTRIFHFGSDGDAEELDQFCGFTMGESTLVAAEVPSGRLVQITPSSATLNDMESGTVVTRWEPPDGQKITNASASQTAILLAVGGVRLVRLSIGLELAMLEETPPRDERQIACVAVSDRLDDVGFVGAWADGSISVVRLDTLQAVHTAIPGEAGGASVPRGLLLAQVLVDQHPTLFVAMADGTVVTYTIDPTTKSISGKKTIVLGTQEAKLQPLPRANGLVNVFASCEHPNLIYGSEGRLVYSAVTTREAVSVCDFDADAYGGSIAVATLDELKIAEIDEERRTHVRNLHIGETVRRVAYSAELKCFALGTIHRKFEKGVESIKSHVKLVDGVLFEVLATYGLNDDELVESAIRAELIDSRKDIVEAFVVGTSYVDDDGRNESMRGRILVFEVDEDRNLRVVTQLATKGSCRCLAVVEGKLVAALTKTVCRSDRIRRDAYTHANGQVVVFSLQYKGARPSLVKLASYRTSTAPIDLAVTGKLIAVADLMKSLSIVQYKAGQDGLSDTMVEVARHHHTAWATAVAHVTDDTYLESDAEGNLMVLHRNRDGVSPEDQVRLEVTSEMLLGEMVNRIRRIDVTFSGNATVIPRAFLATVRITLLLRMSISSSLDQLNADHPPHLSSTQAEGSIYLFALISPKKQDLLMRLQTSIAENVESPGHMSFARFRAFKNAMRDADEPWRFVDGDLIERFLDCTEELQKTIVAGLDMDVDAVRTMVEQLKRLR